MFIRFLNNNGEFNGRGLILNFNEIVSVYEDGPEDGKFVIITSKDKLAWKVKESFEEVHALIEKAQNR